MLHAYRLGGRLGWDALIEAATPSEQAALLPSVAGLMEYVDRVSDAVTETYHDERRHLMSAEEQRVHDLFDQLVAGARLAPGLRELSERIGLALSERYRPFAVRRTQAPAHGHAQLAQAMRQNGVLAVSEGDRVVGLMAADRDAPPADGEGVVAIGEPARGGQLEEALGDVRALLQLAVAASPEVPLRVGDHLPELLLVRSPQLAEALERLALGPLQDYAERRSADLLETLETFMACDLDRRRAAELLHVHPNTLDYRLRRVEELTGLSLARPRDLTMVSLALRKRALSGT
jgi:sugar diacid utilization regulator